MKRALIIGLMTLSLTSPAAARPGDREEKQERRAHASKQMEIGRTLKIADELHLDEQQALHISEILKAGDEKLKTVRGEIRAQVEELRKMAEASPSQRDVDAKIHQIQELRMQQMKVEEETLDNAAKGMSPAQKAKLALVLGVYERQMRKLMFEEENGGPRPPRAPPAP